MALAERYAGFAIAVQGSHMKQPEVEFIDGKAYAWMVLEEPGDFEQGLARFP